MLLRIRAAHGARHDFRARIAHGRLDERKRILARAEDEPRVERMPAEFQHIILFCFRHQKSSFLSSALHRAPPPMKQTISTTSPSARIVCP